jgi:hypothetical protein
VKTEGLVPCVATAYNPNRLAIPQYPTALYKYDIGADGDKTLSFTFDLVPTTCAPNYSKFYEVAVTVKTGGAAVASPSWITLNSH